MVLENKDMKFLKYCYLKYINIFLKNNYLQTKRNLFRINCSTVLLISLMSSQAEGNLDSWVSAFSLLWYILIEIYEEYPASISIFSDNCDILFMISKLDMWKFS